MMRLTDEMRQELTQAAASAIAKNEPFPLAVYSGGKTNHKLSEKKEEFGRLVDTVSLEGKVLLVYKM